MAKATLTSAQVQTLILARQHSDKATRQAIKKEIFAAAKSRFGLPSDMALTTLTRVTKAGERSDMIGVLRNKAGETFELASDGLWVNADRSSLPTGTARFIVLSADKVRDAVRTALEDDLLSSDVQVHSTMPTLADGDYLFTTDADFVEANALA